MLRRAVTITAVSAAMWALAGCASGDAPTPGPGDQAEMRAQAKALGDWVAIDNSTGDKWCALGDFDGNGTTDIAVAEAEVDGQVNQGAVRVYLNKQGALILGTTIPLDGWAPAGIVAKTFDHTAGRTALDLAVVSAPRLASNPIKGVVHILKGDGAGGFALHDEVELKTPPALLTARDCDGARPPHNVCTTDLVVVDTTGSLYVLGNTGDGKFPEPSSGAGTIAHAPVPYLPPGPSGPSGVGEGDLDNDKDVDPEVVVGGADGGGGAVAVFTNLSRRKPLLFARAQTLKPDAEYQPVSFTMVDICGDGFLDVVGVDKREYKDANTGALNQFWRLVAVENRGGVWDWWIGLSSTTQVMHSGVGTPLSISRARLRGLPWQTAGFFVLVGALDAGHIEVFATPVPGRAEAVHVDTTPVQTCIGRHVHCADMNGDGIMDAVTPGGYFKGVP